MNNIMLITIGCLVLLNVVLFIAFRIVSEKLKMAKQKNTEYEYAVQELSAENSKLREEMIIIAKNRREADEKVESLHNGDSITNAIAGLCKPSDSNH